MVRPIQSGARFKTWRMPTVRTELEKTQPSLSVSQTRRDLTWLNFQNAMYITIGTRTRVCAAYSSGNTTVASELWKPTRAAIELLAPNLRRHHTDECFSTTDIG